MEEGTLLSISSGLDAVGPAYVPLTKRSPVESGFCLPSDRGLVLWQLRKWLEPFTLGAAAA